MGYIIFLAHFFFNGTATTEIYTLSLHDALPIFGGFSIMKVVKSTGATLLTGWACRRAIRSEEHTSELQSQSNLVCRLLLEKKNKHLLDHVGIELVNVLNHTQVLLVWAFGSCDYC